MNDAERTNEAFETYYKESGVVPADEWEAFLKCMRSQLPVTFRINGGGKYSLAMRDRMEKDLFSKLGSAEEYVNEAGEKAAKPFALPWYPDRLAWQLSYSRNVLRKVPQLADVHAFIVRENDKGNITRQEAVSMVPPLMLDVQVGDRVLDMCAAPGSKTFQMLEAIHKNGVDKMTSGLVMANDVDAQRCGLLTHQTSRFSSSNMIVVQHEAQDFPRLQEPERNSGKHIMFDRILADVPCTGDGTLRKAPDIWVRWNHNQALGIHPLQARITLRGCELLKVGGRLVYSTCSLNPIEDEAVLAEILRSTNYAMQLVDVSDLFPELKRCPGITKWTVNDRAGRIASYEEAQKGNDPKRRSIIKRSHFPPTEEEAAKMHLERSMRYLPHHNDTGGFFVAVLEKVGEIGHDAEMGAHLSNTAARKRKEKVDGAKSNDEGDDADDAPAKKQKLEGGSSAPVPVLGREEGRRHHRGIDPVVAVTSDAVHSQLKRFYGISSSIDLSTSLMTRNLDAELPKRIYYLSDAAKRVLEADPTGDLKVIATGVKVFERQEAKDADPKNSCSYRVVQEGLYVLLPHMTKQVVTASLMEMRKLLHMRSCRKESFENHVRDQLTNPALGKGCVVLKFDPKLEASDKEEGEVSVINLNDPIFEAGGCAICCWMGEAALSLLCDKVYAAMVLEKLGGPPPQEVIDRCVADKAKAKEEMEKAAANGAAVETAVAT